MDIDTHFLEFPLQGELDLPGDKSFSHRALILAALAEGESILAGINLGDDVTATRQALADLGVVFFEEPHSLKIIGVGLNGFCQPQSVLNLRNSGTTARLLAGVLSGQALRVTLIGDKSLAKRPMERIAEPLRRMGARITTTTPGTLPMTIRGKNYLEPLSYQIPVASAQVKSALLLAGLKAQGPSIIKETCLTRDHTERLFHFLNIPLKITEKQTPQGREKELCVSPIKSLAPFMLTVPKDPSAAAFWAVASTLIPGSAVMLRNVLWNPTRNAFFTILQKMGANIHLETMPANGCESIVNIRAAFAPLKAIEIPPTYVPSLIDEYPILSIAAANAAGVSVFRGLKELRYKESDRLSLLAQCLKQCGVKAEVQGDDLWIQGGAQLQIPVALDTAGDHRIAMAFAVFGLVSPVPIRIHDAEMIATSDPFFLSQILNLLKLRKTA